MPMYNLIEQSGNYSKISEFFWQHCRDEPAIANNGDITDFNAINADTDIFKIKEKITGQTGNNGRKNFEIPLNYLNNVWRTLELSLINCEINLDLNSFENCVIVATNVAAQNTAFSITDTKLFVPVVTLSTEDNTKLLKIKCWF